VCFLCIVYYYCSSDKRQFDIGIKLSWAYLHEGDHEEAFTVCERLLELPCISDEDANELSLSRVIASAAAASSQICTSHRRLLVSLEFLCIRVFLTLPYILPCTVSQESQLSCGAEGLAD